MQPAIDAWQPSPESPVLDRPDRPDPSDRSPAPAPRWSAAQRILFRFAFAYLVLYNFPFPLDYIPFNIGLQAYENAQIALIHWVGTYLFHADTSVLPNGSGDTTFNYVHVFCLLAISLAVTAVWSALDRKRTHYARLHEGLRIYIRFALGAAMISYGAYKVVKSQFPAPTLDRLLQPYGDASPMGILWTFMGSSTPYTFFGGISELIGGLLLTVRRTTLLGALISFGVLLNIVMLNFCYDVPVKVYSSHLLVMAIFLVLPDAQRLIDVFVLNRRAAPAPEPPLFERRWLRVGTVVLRTLLVLAFTAFLLNISYRNSQTYAKRDPKWPLYGIWAVDEFVVDGQARPPLVTDTERWRRVVFDSPGTLAVQIMSDSRVRYNLVQKQNLLTLSKRDASKWTATLTSTKPKPDLLELAGTLDGHKLLVKLHREPPPKFLLTTRGFHWINERPFNR